MTMMRHGEFRKWQGCDTSRRGCVALCVHALAALVSAMIGMAVGPAPHAFADSPTSAVAVTVEADAASAARLTQLGKRSIRAHDPSTIVKCKDEYWLFSTGRGILSCHSKDLQRWERGPRVFTNAPPWVAAAVPGNRDAYFWAPDIIHVDGRYLLYYSVSTFGKQNSVIALATNPTLDPADTSYAWKDEGIVVRSTNADDFNAIDPAVTRDVDGKLWLAFGSYWSGIKLIELDPATGKRAAPGPRMYSLARAESIEAPCIYRHGDFYYLFVNWGLCCRGVKSTYNIRVGRSRRITGPYIDKTSKDMLAGGGTLVLGTEGPFVGPGHAGILAEGNRDWFSCHFYDATVGGTGTLSVRPLKWDADGWPVIERYASP